MSRYLTSTLSTILLLFLMTIAAQSEDAADKKNKERSEYELELKKLRQNDPKEYKKTKRLVIVASQMLLGRLGYGLGPYDGVMGKKTEKALREYQKLRNLPVTGDPLSFETLNQVQKDIDLIHYQPVSLPFNFVILDLWQNGYVSAKGTWTFSGEKLGQPEQTTDIQCYRDRRLCIEATAIVSGRGSNRNLSVDTDEYEIERWDEHEIVTKPKQFGCVRYVRRFNRSQKSVTGLRSTTSAEGGCKWIENREFHMTLGDGFEVYLDLYHASKKAVKGLTRFTPEMLKYLDKQPSK